MYNTKGKPQCRLWNLVNSDVSIFSSTIVTKSPSNNPRYVVGKSERVSGNSIQFAQFFCTFKTFLNIQIFI
jgi:hypothetical protein